MKHNFKKVPIFIYLCLATILFSCTYEKEFIENSGRNLEVSHKPLKELLKLDNFKKSYEKVAYVKQKNVASRSALEDEFNFTIVEDRDVNVVIKDSITYYNILIERTINDSIYFENLVFKMDSSEEMDAFIIKYKNPDLVVSEFDEDNMEITPIFVRYSQFCYRVCQVWCNDNFLGETGGHAYNLATCSNSTDLSIDCIPNCESVFTGGTIPNNTGGNPTGEEGSSSSSGGGDGSSTPQEPTPTPNNDGAGSGNDDEIVIAPVFELDPNEDEQENPCLKMIPLKNDTGFKNSLQSLKTAANTNSYETVMVFTNNNSNDPTNMYNYVTTNGTAGNPTASYIYYTGVSKGILHNHYGNLLSIFTITDLEGIYKIVKDPNTIVSDLTFCVVTKAGTVYALTIANKQEFLNFGDKNLNNINDIRYLNNEAIEYYNIKETNDNLKNEQNFLSMMQSLKMGINLFKGNTTNFDTWTRIVKNNKTFTEINCD